MAWFDCILGAFCIAEGHGQRCSHLTTEWTPGGETATPAAAAIAELPQEDPAGTGEGPQPVSKAATAATWLGKGCRDSNIP